jgi:hypothetical protein
MARDGSTVVNEHKSPAGKHVPPLTPGERTLIAKFEELGEGWVVFVRPHLDGDRPSIAILHPEHGAMLWDVREWHVASMRRDAERLITGDERVVLDPIRRLNAVRHRLSQAYVPSWAEAMDTAGNHLFGIVRAGLYLPLATRDDITRLGWSGLREVAVGGDEMPSVGLGRLVPNLNHSVDITADWHEALRDAFSEYHPPSFGGLRSSTRQRELIEREHRPGWWGINGIAGSGKSLVMARRATAMAAVGHRVLLVTYNVTLANYCRALVQDAPDGFVSEMVTVQHFHGLGAAYLRSINVVGPRPGGVPDDEEPDPEEAPDAALQHHYDVVWPAALFAALSARGRPADFVFDTVLVDEAQDFNPAFLDVLQRFGSPGAEFTLAFDTAQRLYSRSNGLDRVDRRRVSRLDRTWRLSPRLADIATALGIAMKVDAPPIVVDEEAIGLFDATNASWVTVDSDAAALVAVRDLLRAWRAELGHRPDSVAVLVRSNEIGVALVEFLASSDIETNHVLPVFNPGQRPTRRQRQDRSRRYKKAFTPHDQRTKVSTIHSYKGWDAERIIFVQPGFDTSDLSSAAIYVAFTRPHTTLAIISDRDLREVRGLFDTHAVDPNPPDLRRAAELLDAAKRQVKKAVTRAPRQMTLH